MSNRLLPPERWTLYRRQRVAAVAQAAVQLYEGGERVTFVRISQIARIPDGSIGLLVRLMKAYGMWPTDALGQPLFVGRTGPRGPRAHNKTHHRIPKVEDTDRPLRLRAAYRKCLGCGKLFESAHCGNRLCEACKGASERSGSIEDGGAAFRSPW